MLQKAGKCSPPLYFLLQSGALCGIIHHGAFNGMARPRKSESLRTHADRKARAR